MFLKTYNRKYKDSIRKDKNQLIFENWEKGQEATDLADSERRISKPGAKTRARSSLFILQKLQKVRGTDSTKYFGKREVETEVLKIRGSLEGV